MNLLIGIKGCEQHQDRWEAIRDTWGVPPENDHDPDIVFFTGPLLGVPDDYASLPLKTQAICRYGIIHDYDFLFLPDSDTYVAVNRLLYSGFEQWDFVGHKNEELQSIFGGPGYWLSRKAMRSISLAKAPLNGNEDVWVSNVLFNDGMGIRHDPRYSLYEDVMPSNNIITRHLSSRESYQVSFMHEAHKKYIDNCK